MQCICCKSETQPWTSNSYLSCGRRLSESSASDTLLLSGARPQICCRVDLGLNNSTQVFSSWSIYRLRWPSPAVFRVWNGADTLGAHHNKREHCSSKFGVQGRKIKSYFTREMKEFVRISLSTSEETLFWVRDAKLLQIHTPLNFLSCLFFVICKWLVIFTSPMNKFLFDQILQRWSFSHHCNQSQNCEY